MAGVYAKGFMRIEHVSLCIVATIVLGGCAFGQRVDYRGSSAIAAPATKGAVVGLGTQDERPYVINGGKEANFVGLNRSLTGIPYNVSTTSGAPLADEIGSLIAGALRTNGATVTQVNIPVGSSSERRLALFKTTNSSRYYLIELREWKTDNYLGSPSFIYDVSLSVIDSRGAILATKNTKGDDKLGSRSDRANLATAISSIFGDLINDPAIISASVGSSTASTDAPSPVPSGFQPGGSCSVDQVLEMKRIGLAEDKIKAACK